LDSICGGSLVTKSKSSLGDELADGDGLEEVDDEGGYGGS
jgi:hypothetical protein